MPTPYSNIFIKASALFKDANLLAELTDQEYEALLELFLSKAKSIYFRSCIKDLTNVDNELQQFNEDLTEQEQWILAEGIRLVWLEQQLYQAEKLRDKISTKDYSYHSSANMIDRLTILVNEARNDLRSHVNDYTFNLFSGFN